MMIATLSLSLNRFKQLKWKDEKTIAEPVKFAVFYVTTAVSMM